MQIIDGIPIWGPPMRGYQSDQDLREAPISCADGGPSQGLCRTDWGGAYRARSVKWRRFRHRVRQQSCVARHAGNLARENIGEIIDEVWKTISFGVGRRNAERVEHALFDASAWKCEAAALSKRWLVNNSVRWDQAITTLICSPTKGIEFYWSSFWLQGTQSQKRPGS